MHQSLTPEHGSILAEKYLNTFVLHPVTQFLFFNIRQKDSLCSTYGLLVFSEGGEMGRSFFE